MIRVDRKLNSTDESDALTDLFSPRGPPDYIRSDNGPEFIAQNVRDWTTAVGAKTAHIEPGSPRENGSGESFNARFRDELLNGEIFYSLREAQILIEQGRIHSNTVRPHCTLGYRPPAPESIQTSRSRLSHRDSVDSQMPRSSAISCRVWPLVSVNLTASRRNSGVGLFPFPIEHLLVPRLVLSTFPGPVQNAKVDRPGGLSRHAMNTCFQTTNVKRETSDLFSVQPYRYRGTRTGHPHRPRSGRRLHRPTGSLQACRWRRSA